MEAVWSALGATAGVAAMLLSPLSIASAVAALGILYVHGYVPVPSWELIRRFRAHIIDTNIIEFDNDSPSGRSSQTSLFSLGSSSWSDWTADGAAVSAGDLFGGDISDDNNENEENIYHPNNGADNLGTSTDERVEGLLQHRRRRNPRRLGTLSHAQVCTQLRGAVSDISGFEERQLEAENESREGVDASAPGAMRGQEGEGRVSSAPTTRSAGNGRSPARNKAYVNGIKPIRL